MNRPKRITKRVNDSFEENGPPTKRMKKNPLAPKRFKSAYMFFSIEMHSKFKAEAEALCPHTQDKTDAVTLAKRVSKAWKDLSEENKKRYHDMAIQDKIRYQAESSIFQGPWHVPADQKEPRDPNRPKRPMSAFLAFSKDHRKLVSQQCGSSKHLSKELSRMWREASPEERQKYQDREFEERALYNEQAAQWKKHQKMQKQHERENLLLPAVDNSPDDSPGRFLGEGFVRNLDPVDCTIKETTSVLFRKPDMSRGMTPMLPPSVPLLDDLESNFPKRSLPRLMRPSDLPLPSSSASPLPRSPPAMRRFTNQARFVVGEKARIPPAPRMEVSIGLPSPLPIPKSWTLDPPLQSQPETLATTPAREWKNLKLEAEMNYPHTAFECSPLEPKSTNSLSNTPSRPLPTGGFSPVRRSMFRTTPPHAAPVATTLKFTPPRPLQETMSTSSSSIQRPYPMHHIVTLSPPKRVFPEASPPFCYY